MIPNANGNPLSKHTEVIKIADNGYETKMSAMDESYTYNYLNQLTGRDRVSSQNAVVHSGFTYDADGNLTLDTENVSPVKKTEYAYGLDNQLIHTVFPNEWHLEKKNTYEMGGRLLRTKTQYINKNTNQPEDWSYFYYYSHDGLAARYESYWKTNLYITRLGRELLSFQYKYDSSSSSSDYFYIQNSRGDVIMLINSLGHASVVTDYDVTGQIIRQAPASWDSFGFTGGIDAGFGLWKLGARYYDSGKGSFIQQDRYMGDPSDPLSLNRYVYCGLDPVNFVDPTGFSRTATVAGTAWWLCAVDTVLPVGDFLYGGLVLATAIAEYGPLFAKTFELGNPFQGNGGSGGPSSNNFDKGPGQVKVLQTGGNTLNNNTLKQLGLTKEQGKVAIEGLKKDLGFRNDFHAKILSNGDILHPKTGNVIGNLFDYLP